MVFRTRERDDGNFELLLDEEGIDYLESGLADLRLEKIGGELSTPSFTNDGAGDFILKKAQAGREE